MTPPTQLYQDVFDKHHCMSALMDMVTAETPEDRLEAWRRWGQGQIGADRRTVAARTAISCCGVAVDINNDGSESQCPTCLRPASYGESVVAHGLEAVGLVPVGPPITIEDRVD